MRLKTPRPTQSASFETQTAAPRDVQSRAKTLMGNLLRAKGLDADEIWAKDLDGWVIPAPVPVLVRLIRVEIPNEDGGKRVEILDYIDAKARLMRLPASGLLALYRYVLEANWQITNTSFAILGEHLYLTSRRPLADLDESELDSMIGHTISATEMFLPVLMEQFALGAVPV